RLTPLPFGHAIAKLGPNVAEDSLMNSYSVGRSASIRVRAAFAACLAIALSLLVTAPRAQQGRPAADGGPLVTIKELMEKTITPATNTLWNAYEPPATEEEWLALEEAAVTLLAAAHVTALGGTGPMDMDWVKQPAWRAYNQAMTDAGFD